LLHFLMTILRVNIERKKTLAANNSQNGAQTKNSLRYKT